MSNHKHHIIPIYKCIELGLTTSYKIDGKEFYFKENCLPTTRLVHADIHWGYYCKDLSTLLEHCNPPQWVIDMIPLGDKRDMWSAQYIALGEIEQIDMSGENSPRWKGGITYDKKAYGQRPERKAYEKKRGQTPERKAYMKEHYQSPEYKAYDKKRKATPEYKAYMKAYDKKRSETPEYKAYHKKYDAERNARKKAERQGEGTLKEFI